MYGNVCNSVLQVSQGNNDRFIVLVQHVFLHGDADGLGGYSRRQGDGAVHQIEIDPSRPGGPGHRVGRRHRPAGNRRKLQGDGDGLRGLVGA